MRILCAIDEERNRMLRDVITTRVTRNLEAAAAEAVTPSMRRIHRRADLRAAELRRGEAA